MQKVPDIKNEGKTLCFSKNAIKIVKRQATGWKTVAIQIYLTKDICIKNNSIIKIFNNLIIQ